MNKLDVIIMAVPRGKLFEAHEFQGFLPAGAHDYHSRIVSYAEYIRRGDVESDASYKQPISCVIVVNRSAKKVFSCQRNSGSTESRLHGTWSCCIGGHVEESERGEADPLVSSLMREMEEELRLPAGAVPRTFGYLNDDSNEVGRHHIGLMYLLELDSGDCQLKDDTLSHGAFLTPEELESRAADDWAKFMIAPLREYFEMV